MEDWDFVKNFIPLDHIDELQGFADGLDLPFEYIAVGYLGHYNIPRYSRSLSMECCNFACWGPATADGKLYHGRSYDVPIWLKDPESGVYVVQENQIVIIREPDDGYASMSVNVAGYLGILGGFNEQGVVIGINGVDSNDETRNGTPVADLMKHILDHTSTAQEAIGHIIGNKTGGRAYIISDYKIPASYAVEISANLSYVGTWDNPVESLYPFWEINKVIRRVNLYHNQTLASTQREKYNTKSFISFLGLLIEFYLNGFSFFPVRRAIKLTPFTPTTFQRTPGRSPMARPFAPPIPSTITRSCSSIKFKAPSPGRKAVMLLPFFLS